jgi:multidrug efflux system outer membrane protein
MPQTYRGETQDEFLEDGIKSFGELYWWEVFNDEVLQGLIYTALENNYDVRIAAARVLEARARLGISRSFLFPELNGEAAGGRVNISENTFDISEDTLDDEGNVFFLGLNLFYEIDFWGRLRRGTEAARAELLATEEAQAVVIQTLVTDLASAYFELRELDLELEIAKRTLLSSEESLRLTRLRKEGGVASGVDVSQSEVFNASVASEVPDIERRIEQKENQISILLGEYPKDISRGMALTEQSLVPSVPPGLPSELLERRPDVREAEQLLVSSNANIGAAKALFFPQITLTGDAGFESSELSDLFEGPSGLWSIFGSLLQPIFTGGRLINNYRAAVARNEQSLLFYQQTILQAFREVSDALVGYRRVQEVRIQQEYLFRSSLDYNRLAVRRYRGGVTSFLEVLDADRQLFSAELSLARARRNELLEVVQLYKALGGGWQQQDGNAVTQSN